MKHTKLVIAGLTAAITLSGASTVFAEDTTAVEPVTVQKTAAAQHNGEADSQEQQEAETESRGDQQEAETGRRDIFSDEKGMMPERFEKMEIDMSGLDLPEDFVPFDEAHVPDGINIPKNGELKPIEFDEEGNMTYGQRPPMFGELEGERPEFTEGERPELPEGEMPQMNGERPELSEGEMPQMNGEMPEFPGGEMPEFTEGERPEIPEGELPQMNGEMPEFQGGSMQPGGRNLQMAGKNQ